MLVQFIIISLLIGFFFTGNDAKESTLVDNTIPGTIEVYSTIHSIGLEWDISGDDNHNAVCTCQFRKLGTTNYSNALPLYRVDFGGYNMLAGSILFLEPGNEYEVLLNLNDPDGGTSSMTKTISTKSIPQIPSGGQTYHVSPGNGGGTGSEADPFLGVEAAESIAQPGDIFLLQAGNYGGAIYLNKAGTSYNHIVWKAAGDGDPIFEGIRLEADYLWLEGLTIVNQQYGLRTSPPGPEGVVVTRCTFLNNHYSIYLNNGGTGWYITDNLIIGDNDPNTSNFSGEGIELDYTSDHTVAYNTISRVGDGISYPHRNVDMFGNDIFDTSDDGIEFDYGHSNNRAWKNRITNALNNGISFQPMNGAPYYVLYNQVAVLNESVLKLRTQSDRALIAHNTFIAKSGPVGYGSQFLENFEIKNNLWISIADRYCWENGENASTNWRTDFDYDGFDWGNYSFAFKWGSSIRLADIPEFFAATGQELHGVEITHQTCFDSLGYASTAGSVDSFYIQFYVLNPNCNAINAGITLANINDGYTGVAPDLGAYELGLPLPYYGIRINCSGNEINEWIGPGTGYWHTDISNWSLNRFPTYCDHVLIEAGFNVKISTDQLGVAATLEVAHGALLETEGTGQIHILNQ